MNISIFVNDFDFIKLDNTNILQSFTLYNINKFIKLSSIRKNIINEMLKFIINQPNVFYYKKDIINMSIIINNLKSLNSSQKLEDIHNYKHLIITPDYSIPCLHSYKVIYNDNIYYLLLNNNLIVKDAIILLKKNGIIIKNICDKDNKNIEPTDLLKNLPNKTIKIISEQKTHDKIYQEKINNSKIEHYYIYILQEKYFIKTKQNIFKIAYTSKNIIQKYKEHPKNSNLLFCCPLNSKICKDYENIIIKQFSSKFIQKKEIGIEYFEGELNKLLLTLINIIKTYL